MKYLNIRKDILATLAYFDMFDYPLKKNEIFIFLGHCNDFPEFEQALNNLIKTSAIFKIGDFYSLQNENKLASRRQRGNEKAALMLKKAEKVAAIIAAFPFVRGVAVSGSLSKYFADEKSDIDFFIITSANRLWIARSLLHLFKKFTYILNMQQLFCMNYFIDEYEPGIPEKNMYTAIEIATLLPLRGIASFDRFFQENIWVRNFFPNKCLTTCSTVKTGSSWLKKFTEKMFSKPFGNALDNFLMNLTEKKWRQKTRANKRDNKGILLCMHIGKHFSKPHPDMFQKKILKQYEESLSDVLRNHEISFLLK